jgi:hypothetical protein
MSAIQKLIQDSTSQMQSDMDAAMETHLLTVKRDLIKSLADQYEFDVDEALQMFAKSDPAVEKKAAKKAKKAKKTKKDPLKPKGPKNLFIHFSQSKRAELAEANPELKTTEITKMLGEMWKLVDEDDRAPYKLLASQDKERYLLEMDSYTPPSSSDED